MIGIRDRKFKERKNNGAKQETPSLIGWRFAFVSGAVGLALVTLVARAAYIQVIETDKLRYQGDLRSLRVEKMPTARGIISDRNGEPLAVSVPVEAVFVDPYKAFQADPNGFTDYKRWDALAEVLDLDSEKMMSKIEKNKNKRFIYLQRQVPPPVADFVKSLGLPGVGLKQESRRYYPTGEISAHLIGVTGLEGHGLEGIERGYDSWLSGEEGERTVRKDRTGKVVENIAVDDKEEGKPMQLSIDQRLQAISYLAIKQAVADYRATSGSLVMVDVRTGEVLAMVNAPSYNPNNREALQSFKMRNRAITDVFEPGSTIKPLVVLSALENEIADEHTVIDTGDGIMAIGGARVRDTSKVGKAGLGEILKKSSNIGVSKLSLSMPVESLLGTYGAFGIGETTGINLIGESQGLYPTDGTWSDFERATLSFGYGLSITPAQLARVYATIGSLGVNHPLSILKVKGNENKGRRVVSEDNARKLLGMLEGVTGKDGTAHSAAISGYRVGAKTGTAKVATAGGYGDEYIAYTAGIAPISDPRLAVVVVINEPQGDKYYGGQVAAPIFSDVMKSALQMLNVAPDAHNSVSQMVKIR